MQVRDFRVSSVWARKDGMTCNDLTKWRQLLMRQYAEYLDTKDGEVKYPKNYGKILVREIKLLDKLIEDIRSFEKLIRLKRG